MKDIWEKLIALLSEMVALYKSVLEISRQKNETLIAAKPKELETLTRKEELLIVRIGKLETARIKLMNQLAEGYNLASETLTFTKLQELAEPAITESLEKIAQGFDTTLGELAPINLLNIALIEQALVFVNYNINLLTRSRTAPTYAPRGQGGQETQGLKLVDRRV